MSTRDWEGLGWALGWGLDGWDSDGGGYAWSSVTTSTLELEEGRLGARGGLGTPGTGDRGATEWTGPGSERGSSCPLLEVLHRRVPFSVCLLDVTLFSILLWNHFTPCLASVSIYCFSVLFLIFCLFVSLGLIWRKFFSPATQYINSVCRQLRVPPVVWFLSYVRLCVTPWTAAHQASLSFTVSLSLLKLRSIESVIPSNHLILQAIANFCFNDYSSFISTPSFVCILHTGLAETPGEDFL